jgi:hypothetical protein
MNVTAQKLRKALNLLKTDAIAHSRKTEERACAEILSLPEDSFERLAAAFSKVISESAD